MELWRAGRLAQYAGLLRLPPPPHPASNTTTPASAATPMDRSDLDTRRFLQQALELVEPANHRWDSVVDVVQHSVVVVAGERDMLEAVAVEGRGEVFCAARAHLLVLVAPECEQRAGQVTDQRVRRQFREFTVERERSPVVEGGFYPCPGCRIGLGGLALTLDLRVEEAVVATDGKAT